MDPKTLSQVVLYVFSPCLLFNLLTTSRLSGADIARVMLFTTVSTLLVGAVTWAGGAALRMSRPVLAGVLLSSMFMNSGNFGLPVVLFAFGETALSFASLYFVTTTILTYSVGTVIASMGSESLLRALSNVFRVPVVYGLILALIFLGTGWTVPMPLAR
jgi:predicted permease